MKSLVHTKELCSRSVPLESALMERDATAALNRAGTQYLCRSATFMNVQLNPALHKPGNTDTSL